MRRVESIWKSRRPLLAARRFALLSLPGWAAFPLPALAEEALPPAGSPARIGWAMRCAGRMPPLLAGSLLVIGGLTALSLLLHFSRRSKKRHE